MCVCVRILLSYTGSFCVFDSAAASKRTPKRQWNIFSEQPSTVQINSHKLLGQNGAKVACPEWNAGEAPSPPPPSFSRSLLSGKDRGGNKCFRGERSTGSTWRMHPDIAAMLICTLSQPTDQERRWWWGMGGPCYDFDGRGIFGEENCEDSPRGGKFNFGWRNQKLGLEEKSLLTNKETGEVELDVSLD